MKSTHGLSDTSVCSFTLSRFRGPRSDPPTRARTRMNPELLEKVLACKTLPSLPAVALKVIELTQDERVRAAELATTIANDQGLSAKLLKTVNSSFYALRKPCTTIQSAIVMLGFSAVKTLALGFSLVSAVADGEDSGFDYQGYWRRGLLSGVAAKVFARAGSSKCEEEAFLGGLLQDIGMVAMHRALGKEYADILAKTNGDHRMLLKHELSDLEVSHADIGSMLATRWKLPPELALPIKYHERPSAAPTECLDICKAVGLGNIAAELLSSSEPGVVLKRLYSRAQELFALSPPEVDELMKAVNAGAKEVAYLLKLDIGQVADPEEVMHRATMQLEAIQVPFEGDSAVNAGPTTDPVTALPNRLVFNRNLVTGYTQATGAKIPFSISLLQIDDLKDLRERHGESYIDALFAQVAKTLKAHFDAAQSLVCRYDDDRFAVVLAKLDRAHATQAVDGARARIAAAPINCQPPGLVTMPMMVTLSAGLCPLDLSTAARIGSADDMVDFATKALDAAVRAGGGCSRVFAPRAA